MATVCVQNETVTDFAGLLLDPNHPARGNYPDIGTGVWLENGGLDDPLAGNADGVDRLRFAGFINTFPACAVNGTARVTVARVQIVAESPGADDGINGGVVLGALDGSILSYMPWDPVNIHLHDGGDPLPSAAPSFDSGVVPLTAAQMAAGVATNIGGDTASDTGAQFAFEVEGVLLETCYDNTGCPAAPAPVDDTDTGIVGTTVTVNAATNDDNTPCAPGCAVYRPGSPLVDPASTAAGAAASVSPTGSVSVDATGPGVVVVNVESGCSPSCDPSGADVDPAGWVAQTVTVTFTDPVVPPAGPASHCFDPSTLLPL